MCFLNSVVQRASARAKELNKFCPPDSSDDLCLFFCIYPSSMGLVYSATPLFLGSTLEEWTSCKSLLAAGNVLSWDAAVAASNRSSGIRQGQVATL